MELKTWLLIAAKEGNSSILVFEVKSFESKRHFVGVVEGGDIGVGHVSAICTFILRTLQRCFSRFSLFSFLSLMKELYFHLLTLSMQYTPRMINGMESI